MTHPVATWSATGMHAGQLVWKRPCRGPQKWRLELSVLREDGYRDTHTIRFDSPAPLAAATEAVTRSINELCDGQPLLDASIEFFIEKPH